jgi:hypothetical protein
MVDDPSPPVAAWATAGAAVVEAVDAGAAVLAAGAAAPKGLGPAGATVLEGVAVCPILPKRDEPPGAGAEGAGADVAAEEADGVLMLPNRPKGPDGAGAAEAAGPLDVATPLDAGEALDVEGAPPSRLADGAGLNSDIPGAPDEGWPAVGNKGLDVVPD